VCAAKLAAATAIYVRVPSRLLNEFDTVAQEHGMSRSEAIREAMKLFMRYTRAPQARSLKGLVSGSRLDSQLLLDQVAP